MVLHKKYIERVTSKAYRHKNRLSSLMGCSASLPKGDALGKGCCEHKSGRDVSTLIALQKLLDSGTITLDECEANKATIVGPSNR